MGCLLMSITEGAFGLIAIEELNPLEIGTLLGNIGGMPKPGLRFINSFHGQKR